MKFKGFSEGCNFSPLVILHSGLVADHGGCRWGWHSSKKCY